MTVLLFNVITLVTVRNVESGKSVDTGPLKIPEIKWNKIKRTFTNYTLKFGFLNFIFSDKFHKYI